MRRCRTVVFTMLVPLLLAAGCGTDSPTEPENRGIKSGLSPYNHIKTFTIKHGPLMEAEADFVAERYDLFVGDKTWIAEMRAINPDILVLAYASAMVNDTEIFGGTCTIHELCAETFAAQEGYDVEDFFLHYREDISYDFNFPVGGLMTVSIPGWNPDREAGDPPATATSRSEARVWATWDYQSRWGNVADPGWQHWTCERIAALNEHGGYELDGVLMDNVARSLPEMEWMHFDKIAEYGEEPVTNSFSMIDDNYAFAVIVRDYLAQTFESPKIIVGNATHPWFLIDETVNCGRLQERYDWFLLECGVRIDNAVVGATCSYEVTWLQILEVMELAKRGKKILFGGKENTWTDRGALFCLSTFYLINHTNMYYAQHGLGLDWFDGIAYDIGLPVGDPYEWATGLDPAAPANTFHIMARSYDHALVLVKFRPEASMSQYTMTSTTHALGASYRPLNADGTLGDPVTEVDLRNNEAAILIPE